MTATRGKEMLLDELRQYDELAVKEKSMMNTGVGALGAAAISSALSVLFIPFIGQILALSGAAAAGYGIVKLRGDKAAARERVVRILGESIARLREKLSATQKAVLHQLLAFLLVRKTAEVDELLALFTESRAAASEVLEHLNALGVVAMVHSANSDVSVGLAHPVIVEFVQHELASGAPLGTASAGA
jgi:hypothetical protein